MIHSSNARIRTPTVAVFIPLVVGFATRFAMAQAVCANATGTWTAGATSLSIAQNGDVIGEAQLNVPASAGSCNQAVAYIGTGSWSNGSVTITLPILGATPPGCASSITLSGSIQGGGCDQLSGTFFNNISGVGTFSFSEPAYTPTESSAASNKWTVLSPLPSNPVQAREDDVPTIGVFEQTLSGGVPNFGGRTITETFPDVSADTDTCHFLESAYPPFIPQPAPAFVLDAQSNNQYQDDVGAPGEYIDYYRYFQRTPCDFATTQVMTISTDNGSEPYATNQMDIHLDPVTISSTRRSGATQTETWGETQAQWETQKTTEQVIETWLIAHGLGI